MHRNSRLSTLPATAMDTGSSTDGGFGSGGGGGAGGGGAQVVPRHLATAVFAMGRLGLLQPLLMDCVAGDVVARPDRCVGVVVAAAAVAQGRGGSRGQCVRGVVIQTSWFTRVAPVSLDHPHGDIVGCFHWARAIPTLPTASG